ncbi:exonuclease domain-containing protein [Rhodoferax sp.]|uniref:exonuclease domain-containing protein n=1 Tax=Rhodoferax sp. TaxID=50421 RepID=UPI0034176EAF
MGSLRAYVQGAECFMHNASFDTGFIDSEMSAAGRTERLQDLGSIACTVSIAKSRFPGETASLDALILKSGLSTKRNKHSALEDAQLLAEVYLKLLTSPPSEVHISICQPEIKKRMQFTTTSQKISPEQLGMEKVIELTGSRKETFFYREKHKRIIDHRVVNERRWKKVCGPLLYAVTDHTDEVRYIGKWVTANALYNRWVRHDTIHHGECTRNFYLAELDAGRGPLTVWSISVDELKKKLPSTVSAMHSKDIAVGLEALWISRWKTQLRWNTKLERLTPGFLDGEYWHV